jgi:hypothetical protein
MDQPARIHVVCDSCTDCDITDAPFGSEAFVKRNQHISRLELWLFSKLSFVVPPMNLPATPSVPAQHTSYHSHMSTLQTIISASLLFRRHIDTQPYITKPKTTTTRTPGTTYPAISKPLAMGLLSRPASTSR